MAVSLPEGPLPPSLAMKALPILLKRLQATTANEMSSTANLALLNTALRAATIVYGPGADDLPDTSAPIVPLQSLLRAAHAQAAHITVQLLLDVTVVYFNYPDQLNEIWASVLAMQPELLEALRSQVIPGMIERLRLSPSVKSLYVFAYTLRALSAAHEELFGLILSEADGIIPALRDGYHKALSNTSGGDVGGDAVLRAKEAVLLLVKEAADALGPSADEGLKRLMRDPDVHESSERTGNGTLSKTVEDASLLADFLATFDTRSVDDETRSALREFVDTRARRDPRLAPLLPLFPEISPSTLLSALDHPAFAPSSSTATFESAAAPLIDAIFSGGDALPVELVDLREAVRNIPRDHAHPGAGSHSGTSSSRNTSSREAAADRSRPARYERRNIFDDDELDFSRLRLGKDPLNMPQVGESIPDHLRASILRLVENQKIEAEAEARAVAEARGEVYRPPKDLYAVDGDDLDDEGVGRLRIQERSSGDESGEEDESGDKVIERSASGGPRVDIDVQTKLELAYLSDPRIFDRDSLTRKSQARRQLKTDTGMDDSQLEGWRIMLERNPHKEAILARHALVPRQNTVAAPPSRPSSDAGGSRRAGGGSDGRGGGGSRGGGRGGSRGGHGSHGEHRGGAGGGGGASGGGGGGGSSRGGGGGGRGQNKGSRGHSNAARTRGHDRKMARMGGP